MQQDLRTAGGGSDERCQKARSFNPTRSLQVGPSTLWVAGRHSPLLAANQYVQGQLHNRLTRAQNNFDRG